MIYNFMDDILKEINQINNIDYINFYDITTNDKDSMVVIPALFINYDNNKQMNISIKDKYFNEFVTKVLEVYNREKSNTIEIIEDEITVFDGIKEKKRKIYTQETINSKGETEYQEINPFLPLSKKTVKMNKRTKKILENADILNKNEITGFYTDKDGFSNSLSFECDEMKGILSTVKYIIKEFATFANFNIEFLDNFRGYRTNYAMETLINNILTDIFIKYIKIDNDNYDVTVMIKGKPININIMFMDNSIHIVTRYNDIEMTYDFMVSEKGGFYLKNIYKDGNLENYLHGSLDKEDIANRNIVDLENTNDSTWYKLPWGAYLGHHNTSEKLDESSIINTKHVTYYEELENSFFLREFFTKEVKGLSEEVKKRKNMVIDELRKVSMGYIAKPYFIIETAFKDARGDGIYQEKYNGKYFYHITNADKLSMITRDNLVSVRKQDINDKSDLVDEEKLKKIGGLK